MKLITILLLVMFFLNPAFSQNIDKITISGSVVDKGNQQYLPYATIYNINKKQGTAADLNGIFKLPANAIGDSIVISFIGYDDYVFIAEKEVKLRIELVKASNLIGEITIRAEDEYLYKIVRNIKKNKSTDPLKAKTYFYLETTHLGKTNEIIETYYNGQYQDGKCQELELKKGRIGVKPIENRYFVSTETSKVFVLHDNFKSNKLFPLNPLYLKKRKLRKKYILELIEIFKNDGQEYYNIGFKPRKKGHDAFHGNIIVNVNNNTLKKVVFNINSTKVHPFVPIGGIKLKNIDISVTKNYDVINDKSFMNEMYFNYNLTYFDRDSNIVDTKTNAFIKPFDYENEYYSTLFNYSDGLHKDYRDITLAPYDSIYWNNHNQFCFFDKKDEINAFVKNNFIDNKFIFDTKDKPQLEFSYNIWDPERIRIREADAKTIEIQSTRTFLEEDRYNLNVKLYLDYSIVNGELHYQLYSLIDPMNTYYYFYIDRTDHAFINMYFDLMEVEKRNLAQELSQLKTSEIDQIESLYNNAVKRYKQNVKSFTNDVSRGSNFVKMKEWNTIIDRAIHINNLELFGFQTTLAKN